MLENMIISGLMHEASWTNSEFQSRFRVDKAKQIQPGLDQVQQAHKARYKRYLLKIKSLLKLNINLPG